MTKIYSVLILAIVFASNVMAQNIPSYVPKNGLVGWWPFNGNANDESGNGNNGTVKGATLSTDRNGKANSAYIFDGVSSYIEIKDSPSLDIDGNISLSLWFNTNVLNASRLIDKTTVNYADAYMIDLSGSISNQYDRIRFIVANAGAPQPQSNPFQLVEKQFFHIVVTYDQSNVKFFVNGLLNRVLPKTGISLNNNNPLRFGANSLLNGNWFNGQLDDIAIYNRALTEQEIKQLYEGCPKETAISSSFNYPAFITGKPVSLIAEPQGGVFKGVSVENNQFVPAKAKIGTNKIQYNFKNSNGCNDSTLFSMIVADTVGNTCVKYDTILKIKFKLTTGIKANQYTSLLVYPNPTSDVLVLELSDLDALKAYKYRIMDLLGKEMYNAPIISMKTEIPLKTLGAKGMYVLHILDANNVSIQAKQIVLE